MTHMIHNVLPVPPRQIAYVDESDTLEQCIKLMRDLDIGALVVLDERKNLLGILSERDIVRSAVAGKGDFKKRQAKDVVNKKASILSPGDSVEKAMQEITRTKRRHVLIRDNNELIAIISIGDLMFHILEDKSRIIEHLENYIHT